MTTFIQRSIGLGKEFNQHKATPNLFELMSFFKSKLEHLFYSLGKKDRWAETSLTRISPRAALQGKKITGICFCALQMPSCCYSSLETWPAAQAGLRLLQLRPIACVMLYLQRITTLVIGRLVRMEKHQNVQALVDTG